MMPTVLITGSNRGVGLEFVRQYAAEGWRVHATCRKPEAAAKLKAIKGDVRVHKLDVTDEAGIAGLAKSLGGEAIDLLINNAGVLPEDEQLGTTDTKAWMETLRINTIAPIHMVEQFIEHVARSERRQIVNITSRMGSIGDNTSGESYAYRTSKAALNMAMKNAAIELAPRGVTVVLFHPGWVKTDMGGPDAAVEPQDSVAGMRAKIAALTKLDNGKFYTYEGLPLPW
jgi:NAD(P)-dependent dehydrogenase (short-subunit alcohol dehydrogenase family)